MILWMLLSAALSADYSFAVMDEEQKVVCSGKDFSLPVQSRLRVVLFSPRFSPGSTRVVLENNKVMDPRYEWTGDKMLLLKEVTERDQGLFKLKMSSGTIYRKIRLTVVDCIKSFSLFYGDDFKIDISHGGAVIEFSPEGSQSFPQSLILWNSSVPWESQRGRGSVKGGHWILEGVTQADQGNYTLRDGSRQLLSTVRLNVGEHSFSFTYFTGESLILPLFLPFSKAHLSFIPSSTSSHSFAGHRATVLLVRDGQVVTKEERYKGQLTLAQVDDANEIVIAQLRLEDSGVYEIRDREGNLVSSTWLEVVKKPKWKANFKSIAAPLSGFGFVALIIYFKKKYSSWNMKNRNAQRNQNMTAFSPHVYNEAYSHPNPESLPGQPQWSEPLVNWSNGSMNAAYTPVLSGAYGPPAATEVEEESASRSETGTTTLVSRTEETERERTTTTMTTSITLPVNSDCLHSSDSCAQFQIEKEEKEPGKEGKEYFSALPLNTDTSQSCSVYTSDKLNFL
ncbi:uncharacterized protein LOC108935927 isoform X1 [Scleropages formosus]|uniref:Uncharacterized LOC108935927 n=1 Tax=Scleropages formosus TaxID=113540 RepID=A0A8C9QYP1_SCLFO|nr:uncharacterized protein LOC108935927 isoform X1 [Scleropages formosus]